MENQRNFGALLGGSTPVNGMPTKERVELLPVDLIDPHPLNPRIVIPEGLDEAFLESVERNGVLQPVFVKLGEGGRYQMLAGHRRLCASKVAKHTHIRAIVKRKLLPGEESVFLMDTNIQTILRTCYRAKSAGRCVYNMMAYGKCGAMPS